MQRYEKKSIATALDKAVPERRIDLTQKQIAGLKTASQVILSLAGTVGIVALAVLAPNAVQILGKVSRGRGFKSKEFRSLQKRRIQKSLYYLKESGVIEFSYTAKDVFVKLTGKGRGKMVSLNFQTVTLPEHMIWNKRWWLILADIPSETHKTRADLFRRKLKALKCFSLQRTVWVYPFDIRDEIDFIARHFTLEKFVTMMEVVRADVSDQKILTDFFRKENIIPS